MTTKTIHTFLYSTIYRQRVYKRTHCITIIVHSSRYNPLSTILWWHSARGRGWSVQQRPLRWLESIHSILKNYSTDNLSKIWRNMLRLNNNKPTNINNYCYIVINTWLCTNGKIASLTLLHITWDYIVYGQNIIQQSTGVSISIITDNNYRLLACTIVKRDTIIHG